MALIYIVEDDKNIREIEAFALKNSGYRVKDFECAAQFYSGMADKLPNLILLDVMLPDEDGLNIVKKIRSHPESRKIPIIMVTAKTTELDKVKGLDMGADDYLTKPFNILELKARIRALLRRANSAEKKTVGNTLTIGNITLDLDARNAYRNGQIADLTAKEFDVIEFLMRNPNRVYSQEALLDTIWAYEYRSDIRTVDVHIRRLREKLEENSAEPKYILTKWGVGYYFRK
jgi:two-component system alkaline phosphatase synthesis response regulator PhoP